MSATEFSQRVAHRWQILLPGAAGGIVWVAQMVGVDLKLPGWVPWAVIGLSFLVAIFWAFHDLRVEGDARISKLESSDSSDARFPALSDVLGRSLTVGVGLSEQREWPPLNAWKLHTERLVASAYGEGEAAHVFTPELKTPTVTKTRSLAMAMVERPPLLAEEINGLKALLGRMPTLAIRPNFDLADWSVFDPEAYRATHARPFDAAQEGTWTCPWCRRGAGAHTHKCNCGAEISGDLVYAPPPLPEHLSS